MLTRIQNVGHILDIISYFEHLLDIFWTFFAKICPNLLVWAHLGHILDTLCENVSKKCPSLHRAGAPACYVILVKVSEAVPQGLEK